MTTLEILKAHGFNMGRMISGSKSGYRMAFPNNVCHFNANIITANDGKVWYGDLDLTMDADELKLVAYEADTILYVLREADCRWGQANDDVLALIGKSVWNTTQETPFE
jgi:hypothetical protein